MDFDTASAAGESHTRHSIIPRPRELRALLARLEAEEDTEANGRRVAGPRHPPSTGLPCLDHLIGPLAPGSIHLIGGRPSTGKTALLLQIGRHASVASRMPVLLVSARLRAEAVALRLLASEAKLDPIALRDDRLDDDEERALAAARVRLDDAPFLVWDGGHGAAHDLPIVLESVCVRRTRPSLVLIDDLGLLFADYVRTPLLRKEIATLVDALSTFARRSECAVLITLPADRGAEHRADHRPKVKDLAWAKGLTERVDGTLLSHRPEIYDPTAPPSFEVALHRGRRAFGAPVRLCFDHRGCTIGESA